MAGALAIEQGALDALTGRQQVAIFGALATIHLAAPALRQRPSTGVWYYTYSRRISPLDCAYVAVVATNLDDIPADWFPPFEPFGLKIDVPAFRAQVRGFVQARIVPLPEVPDGEVGPANPWQAAIDLNGAPPSLLGAPTVPSDWPSPASD